MDIHAHELANSLHDSLGLRCKLSSRRQYQCLHPTESMLPNINLSFMMILEQVLHMHDTAPMHYRAK
jgi:hypothetical protein